MLFNGRSVDLAVPTPSASPTHWTGQSRVIAGPSPSWKGFHEIRYVFLFGDSYSSTGPPFNMPGPEPSDEEPLGLPFPGITTCEPGRANWIGHLITEYSLSPLLVYNYAMSGATASDVRTQIETFFLPRAGAPSRKVPWTAENSLFITWVGINDLAYPGEIRSVMTQLFTVQERLYDAGARNFMFIDIPPIDRSPACTKLTMFDVDDDDREATINAAKERFIGWNIALDQFTRRFASSKASKKAPPPTILYHSAHKTMTNILDDPSDHCFNTEDVSKLEGEIWTDHIHVTSRVHDFIAKDIGTFLSGIARS